MKGRVGRPNKYESRLMPAGIYLPTTTFYYLLDRAKEKGYSKNEYVNYLISNSDEKLAESVMDRLKILESKLKKYELLIDKSNKDRDDLYKITESLSNQLKEFNKTNCMTKFDYDPAIKEFLDTKINKMASKLNYYDDLYKKIYELAEEHFISKQYRITNKAIAMATIKAWIKNNKNKFNHKIQLEKYRG